MTWEGTGLGPHWTRFWGLGTRMLEIGARGGRTPLQGCGWRQGAAGFVCEL